MALGAEGFRSGAGLLALVAQQVAEGGELAAVAAVVEALGFGPRVEDARHHGAGLRAGRRRQRGHAAGGRRGEVVGRRVGRVGGWRC